MFKSVEARFALRSFLFGVSAFATTLFTSIPLDVVDVEKGVLAGVIASLAYAGVGASVPFVEPSIGVKGDG